MFEGYCQKRAAQSGFAASDFQAEVRRLGGGEPGAALLSRGGNWADLKAKVAGKDDAAVLEVLGSEYRSALYSYSDAQARIAIIGSRVSDPASGLLEKHLKRIEVLEQELKDLRSMCEA
ncbi:hypothetical protein Q7P35_008290 [Cladosporium inversicolor]